MIYVLASVKPESELPDAVVEAAKGIHQLGNNQPVWFIDIDCTNGELVDMLWPDDEEDESSVGNGIVVDLETYGGYAPNVLWKWLKAKRK